MMAHELSIGFVGNPNCGKTTLFNAYTGANLKVANWPGVTVEKKEGRFQYHDHEYKLVDLPGTYSLTSYTMEEQVSRQYILSDDVDVIIDVADASALERNLYLTLWRSTRIVCLRCWAFLSSQFRRAVKQVLIF